MEFSRRSDGSHILAFCGRVKTKLLTVSQGLNGIPVLSAESWSVSCTARVSDSFGSGETKEDRII